MVVSLDDFEEEGGSVLDGLGEDLEEVALVVVVDQDLVLLQDVDVLRHLDVHVGEVLPDVVVVGVRDAQKLHSSAPHVFHSPDYLLGVESDVLHACVVVVVDVLLNLALLLPVGRLVDGHLHVLVVVRHHDRPQGGVLGVNHRVVHRPEPVETQSVLVVLDRRLHLQVGLVAHYVVDLLKPDGSHNSVEGLLVVVRLVPRQEGSSVVYVLNECVGRVPVGPDGSHDNGSVLVGELAGRRDGDSAVGGRVLVDGLGVLDVEGDVLDSVSMVNKVLVHFFGTVLVVDRAETESGSLVVPDHVAGDLSLPVFKALVGEVFEPEAGGVVGGRLFGVSDPEGEVS